MVEFDLSEEGVIENPRVIQSNAPHENVVAIRVLRKMNFDPKLTGDKPVRRENLRSTYYGGTPEPGSEKTINQ